MRDEEQTPEEVDADGLTAAYQEATDDIDRPGPGRPEIGGAALIRFGDLLARVDARAGEEHTSRPELIRRAVAAYLDPVEPTIEAVQNHLRAGFTAVLHASGTLNPSVSLFRTRDEARKHIDDLAEVLTRDGDWEVLTHSTSHLVLKASLTSQLGWYTVVEDARVTTTPSTTLGEAKLCRRLGLDPADLWVDSR